MASFRTALRAVSTAIGPAITAEFCMSPSIPARRPRDGAPARAALVRGLEGGVCQERSR
jgi:hypothetical protein